MIQNCSAFDLHSLTSQTAYPWATQNIEHFVPDPEKVEEYGSAEAAVNNALEVTLFVPQGRKDEKTCQKPLT
jgi:hypothetical protein